MSTVVNTSRVEGRRKLRFESLGDVLADVEQLAAHPYRQLGNWPLGKMAQHLAQALDSTTDNRQFVPPRIVCWIGPLLKPWILSRPLPSGLQMTPRMKELFMPPDEVETRAGIEALRRAIGRFEQAAELPDRSPSLGRMSRAEWTAFHCRHAEMHLSFLVPDEPTVGSGQLGNPST